MPLLELRILEKHSFPHFSLTRFDILSWNFAHDFVIRPSSDGTYYGMVMSVRPGLCPSFRHSFPHFSPTCFDILIWNFVYHFIFMHVRSSSNAINFRHFLQELCFFLTSNSYKYAVFRTFLLHALTYLVQICIWLWFNVPQSKFECRYFASIFDGVMPLCELRILEIHSFPHFSLTCFDILSWNFAYDFVLLYYRSSSSVVNLHQFFLELCPFWNLEYWKYTVFRTFLLHSSTYWAERLHITLFFCTTDQVWISSICVYFGVMPLFELRIL